MKYTLHSGKLGDVIYCLPALGHIQGKLLLNCCLPRTDEAPLTVEHAGQLAELAEAAGYQAAIWDGQQPFDVDFDRFRESALAFRWRHLVDCHWDLVSSTSSPRGRWLRLPALQVAPIIITRTCRYPATGLFDWSVLKEADCVFVGLRDEWRTFCRDFFPVPFHPTSTLLEFASVIAGAELFVGNQSFAFAIAEGLDLPRRLEVRPEHLCNQPRTPRGRTQISVADLELVSSGAGRPTNLRMAG
ncbi:MAG TPA: hypothetical protein VGZ47_22660 [Gemmataceae bacterium]|jgi:hypothetical protein|nr:hypothetical protein [Gemmataceae bacterium]